MSSSIAIKVESLGKCFYLYESPIQRLLQILAKKVDFDIPKFWALQNISFEIKRGQVYGIVGANGSGKSTLLQLICGTMSPSTGNIQVNGRIAALLELGSGFNPEFTGRENIFLNASILGLTHKETQDRLTEILSFADIGEFIDQPVKNYSSGMIVRLAFSVAVCVDPEILVVDEALTVGDEFFQRKCFARIEKIKLTGATILFVSHSANQIIDLCDVALLIDHGELLTSGSPKRIIGQYHKLLYASSEQALNVRDSIRNSSDDDLDNKLAPDHYLSLQVNKVSSSSDDYYDAAFQSVSAIEYGEHKAIISQAEIINTQGLTVNSLNRGNTYIFQYRASFSTSSSNVKFGMLIKTITGFGLGGMSSGSYLGSGITYIESGKEFLVKFHFECNLNPGIYFLNAGILGLNESGVQVFLHRVLDIYAFKVLPIENNLASEVVDFKGSIFIDELHQN